MNYLHAIHSLIHSKFIHSIRLPTFVQNFTTVNDHPALAMDYRLSTMD